MRARICTGAEWEGQVQNSLAHFKQAISETRTGLNEDSVLVWIWHISDRDPKNQIELRHQAILTPTNSLMLTIHILKGQFTQKFKFCHHLFSLK